MQAATAAARLGWPPLNTSMNQCAAPQFSKLSSALPFQIGKVEVTPITIVQTFGSHGLLRQRDGWGVTGGAVPTALGTPICEAISALANTTGATAQEGFLVQGLLPLNTREMLSGLVCLKEKGTLIGFIVPSRAESLSARYSKRLDSRHARRRTWWR